MKRVFEFSVILKNYKTKTVVKSGPLFTAQITVPNCYSFPLLLLKLSFVFAQVKTNVLFIICFTTLVTASMLVKNVEFKNILCRHKT